MFLTNFKWKRKGICVNSCWVWWWMYGYCTLLATILYTWIFFHNYVKQKSPPSFQLFIAAPHWGPGSPMLISCPGLCCFPGGWRSWVVGTPLSLPSQVCSLHPWPPTYWVRYEYGSRDWMEKYGEISRAEWVQDFSKVAHHFPPTETLTDSFPGQDTYLKKSYQFFLLEMWCFLHI